MYYIRERPNAPLDYFHVSSGKGPRIVRHEHAVGLFRENNWEGQGREGDVCHADAVAAQVRPPVREDALHAPVHARRRRTQCAHSEGGSMEPTVNFSRKPTLQQFISPILGPLD